MKIDQLQIKIKGQSAEQILNFDSPIGIVYGSDSDVNRMVEKSTEWLFYGQESLMDSAYDEVQMKMNYQGQIYQMSRNMALNENINIQNIKNKSVVSNSQTVRNLIVDLSPICYKTLICCDDLQNQTEEKIDECLQSLINDGLIGEEIDLNQVMNHLRTEGERWMAAMQENKYRDLLHQETLLKEKMASDDHSDVMQKNFEEASRMLERKIEDKASSLNKLEMTEQRARRQGMKLSKKVKDLSMLLNNQQAELEYLQKESGTQQYRERIKQELLNYEKDQSRYEKLQQMIANREDSHIPMVKILALVTPLIFISIVLFTSGSLLIDDLKIRMGIGAAFLLLAFGIFAICSFLSHGVAKNIQIWESEIEEIEQRHLQVLDEYHIKSIEELKKQSLLNQRRQDIISKMKKEIAGIEKQLIQTKEAVVPYIELYGEDMMLNQNVGQKERKEIEALEAERRKYLDEIDSIKRKRVQQIQLQKEYKELRMQIEELLEHRQHCRKELQAIRLSLQIFRDLKGRRPDAMKQQWQNLLNQAQNIEKEYRYLYIKMVTAAWLFGEKMPLILNQAFIKMEDEQLEKYLKWLIEHPLYSQLIILTCHHREENMIGQMGIKYSLHQL